MRGYRHKKWIKVLLRILFGIYIVALAYFLFFSERYGRSGIQEYRYNLEPFQEIRRYLRYRKRLGMEYFVVNIFGNILAFAPFGFFVPVVSPSNRHFASAVLYSFEFSLLIELVQLSFQVGIFDVDDLIMNTLGGVVGYLVFLLVKKRIEGIL